MNNQQGSRQRLYLISFIFIVLVAGLCFVWQFRLFQGYKQIWQQEEQRYQAASKRLAVAKSLGERQQQLAREAAVLSQLLPAETAEEQLLLGLQ